MKYEDIEGERRGNVKSDMKTVIRAAIIFFASTCNFCHLVLITFFQLLPCRCHYLFIF